MEAKQEREEMEEAATLEERGERQVSAEIQAPGRIAAQAETEAGPHRIAEAGTAVLNPTGGTQVQADLLPVLLARGF